MDSSVGTVLIPALGLSERFAAEGHVGPKALLPITLAGETLPTIRRIVRAVPRGWRVLIMAPAAHAWAFHDATESFSMNIDVIGVGGTTQGQSDTILRGLQYCMDDRPVLIQNCDVVFDAMYMRSLLEPPPVLYNMVALHMDTGSDPIFSYVDSFAYPHAYAEKTRLSEWAMTGLWLFRRAGALKDAIEQQMREGLRHTNGEFYLSGALNFLSDPMHGKLARPTDWVDLGTPAAVRAAGGKILG